MILRLKLASKRLRRLFKKVLLGCFEVDTEIGSKVTMFWSVEDLSRTDRMRSLSRPES
jgi:hypothetical protein